MSIRGPLLAFPLLLGITASCNFDAAFNRYCENNPRCRPDSGSDAAAKPSSDGGKDTSTVPVPDSSSDTMTVPGPDSADDAPTMPNPDGDSDTWAVPNPDGDNETAAPPELPLPPRNCGPANPCTGPNEICHPFGQVCMTTCTMVADCPPWLDACTDIRDPRGTGHTAKVCSCTSAQLCNNHANGFTCNSFDNLCEPFCETSQDCSGFQPGRKCDKSSGLCLANMPTCLSNADCPSAAQARCDPTNSRCVGCIQPADCAGRLDGLTQCSPGGACTGP